MRAPRQQQRNKGRQIFPRPPPPARAAPLLRFRSFCMPQYHLESKLLLLNLFIKRQARGEGLGCEGRESKVAFFASVVCRRNHRSKKLRVPPSDPFLSRPFRPLRSSPVVERERFLIGCAEKKHYGRTRRSLLAPKTVALLVWSQPRFRNLARTRSTLNFFNFLSSNPKTDG